MGKSKSRGRSVAPVSEKKAHVFVATPTYSGELHHKFVQSYADALYYSLYHGVRLDLRVIAGSSLIQYARNQLLREFLANKEATHMLWIDSDVGFDPRAIMQLLSHDKDIVGGVYPMKSMPIEWPYEPMPGEQTTELHRATTLPGGFLLCTREACEKIAEQAPTYMHHMDGVQFETRHVFDVVLEDGLLLGEDIIFSRRAREAGFDVWVDPNIDFSHNGQFSWRGNMAQAIEQGSVNRPLNHQTLKALATDSDSESLFARLKELHSAWGNEWSAPPSELLALVHMARQSKRILEAGSGLSTLVMAAANPEAEIVALENDYEWTKKVIDNCKTHGLHNVTVCLTPLNQQDLCYEMPSDFPDEKYDLAFIDGPAFFEGTENPGDSRKAFYDRFGHVIEGASVVIDDIGQYPGILNRYENYEQIGNRFAICVPGESREVA